ncbi:MAG TPA: hypothetical protein VLW86_09135, partial [Syntrophorhabdales bacterium]|nr:hypothetical protein [Syntrophorhabdales bacterium]
LVAVEGSPVQRRVAAIVLAERQIRIVFEKLFDLARVTSLGGVMNFSAENGAIQDEHEQSDKRYGRAAGDWGMAKPAE